MIEFALILFAAGCFASVFLPCERVFSFVFSCIIHEAGHILAAKGAGGRAESIRPAPFRFSVAISGLSDYRDEIIVALAGPLFNFVSAICAILIFKKDGYFFASVSFATGLLNLLPISVLDGGRTLEAALNIFLSPTLTTRGCAVVSDLIVFSIVLASAYRMLRVGDSFLIFLFSLLCMIGKGDNIQDGVNKRIF